MNCTGCRDKQCRTLSDCKRETFDTSEIEAHYQEHHTQKIVEAAARLVDNGRAGVLSRLEEVIEFTKEMGYKKIGLAFCYCMEEAAKLVAKILKENGLSVSSVSCAVGALAQKDVNNKSELPGLSCNPIGQAVQLNNENVDFVIVMGLCMGHDVIFQNNIKADFTTLVVKDRTNNHNPIKSIKQLKNQ